MKLKSTRVFLAVTTLTLAMLACQAVSGGAEATSVPTSAPTPIVEVPSLPPLVASKGTGITCVGMRAGGVNCLTESGWQSFTAENSNLPSNYVDAGALCPDGRIAISHYDGVSFFNGEAWENISSADNYSSAEAIACEAGGGIWVAHFQGVSHYVNGAWTNYASAELATGESANELVYDVDVASDGKVWVVTSRSVAVFDQNTWKIFQQGQGFDEAVFFNTLVVDSLGRPWVGLGDGVYVFENDTWKKIDRSDYNSPQNMTVDSRGQIWLGTLSDGASTFNGNSWSTFNRSSQNLSSDHVTALASDTLGRVWVGTTYGLTVFDGANWQTLRMDNSDITDNYIEFVVVSNDGPVLPVLAEKTKASLTGSLNDVNKKPMAGMRVEICVEPISSQFSGETPCSDQPFFLSTQTDANGVFKFENVPAGYYVIVAETGTGWARLTDEFGISSERTLIPAGENYDIGVLTLEE